VPAVIMILATATTNCLQVLSEPLMLDSNRLGPAYKRCASIAGDVHPPTLQPPLRPYSAVRDAGPPILLLKPLDPHE
jgi:hypothetical protein